MAIAAMGLVSCNEEVSEPPVNNPGIHYGTWDDPMTAYQVSLGPTAEGYTSVWVTGYIVGCVNTGISNTCSAKSADFSTPAPVNTNILMADSPDETDWTKCITVQLPSGEVRNALNMTIADNKGKQVTILGTTGAKYCSVYGVKAVSAYKWGDKGDASINIIAKPATPAIVGQTIYTALDPASTTLTEGWTIDNVTAGINVFTWKLYNNAYYLNGSAYSGSAKAATAYCYSPVISLEGYASATLSFDHAAKFQTTCKELCKAVVREEGATDWVELTIPEWQEPDVKWDFVSSGAIDISAYAGKKVQVGVKYGSTDAGADTWEVRSLKVTGTK